MMLKAFSSIEFYKGNDIKGLLSIKLSNFTFKSLISKKKSLVCPTANVIIYNLDVDVIRSAT